MTRLEMRPGRGIDCCVAWSWKFRGRCRFQCDRSWMRWRSPIPVFDGLDEERMMGEIHVHEFMSLDGGSDAPTWTADFGFTPRMGELVGGVMGDSTALLLGRTTYQMFEPAWSSRTVEDDPGAPFFNDARKYVVSSTLIDPTWQ